MEHYLEEEEEEEEEVEEEDDDDDDDDDDDSDDDDELQDLSDESYKYEYFWRARSPFSQWHRSKFVLDGINFNCAEQYMMYRKALLIEDYERAEIILALDNPQEINEVGKKLKGIDNEVWHDRCQEIVEAGNMAKNEELKQKLFNTYPKTLVAACPFDSVLGIGLGRRDRGARNKHTWRGQNLLGKILTNVRDKLMEPFLQPAETKMDEVNHDEHIDDHKLTERTIDGNCKICFNACRNTAFKPCGHVVCCMKCAKKFKKNCPVCRSPVKSVDKIFLS